MTEYLVEAYVPRLAAAAVHGVVEATARAAEEVTREGTPVNVVRSIFVPEEETCFYLFRSPSLEAVRETAERAGLHLERVSEAVSEWPAVPCWPWTGVGGQAR